MNVLFDTNILLYLARDTSGYKILQAVNPDNRNIHVSFASIAEIESIAFQQNWSADRRHRLEMALDEAQIVEMSQTFLKTYIDIDAYSQRRHPNFTAVPFSTPRNMGKHDLWRSAVAVAATASLLGLTLVTTDADFDHLHGPFLDLRSVTPASLRSLMS